MSKRSLPVSTVKKPYLAFQLDHNGTPRITIDLDAFALELEQGFASGVDVVRVDVVRGGKRITVGLDLFQHELKRDPTMRLTAVHRGRDVTRTLQVRPWTEV